MYMYFPKNYAWSLITLVIMENVGTVSEIADAIEPLRDVQQADPEVGGLAWYEVWTKLGCHLEDLGQEDEKAGRTLSASRKYFRAANYRLCAIRFLFHEDDQYLPSYRQSIALFNKALKFRGDPVEWVEIPFGARTLKALFVKANTEARAPCMIHFNGFDVTKEYMYHPIASPFTRRGVSLLITDQPGTGAALIEDGITIDPESEHAAGACIDYLESRDDVDPECIGIIGVSLGGYYAPRAAAFEKRLKCCIAWGGIWNEGELYEAQLTDPDRARSINDWDRYAMWVSGTDNLEDSLTFYHRLTLEGVADKITCPLLVMHGENDQQVLLGVSAERTVSEAVNSPRAELKVFTLEHGGAEHCHADNVMLGTDYMADWAADVLRVKEPVGSPESV